MEPKARSIWPCLPVCSNPASQSASGSQVVKARMGVSLLLREPEHLCPCAPCPSPSAMSLTWSRTWMRSTTRGRSCNASKFRKLSSGHSWGWVPIPNLRALLLKQYFGWSRRSHLSCLLVHKAPQNGSWHVAVSPTSGCWPAIPAHVCSSIQLGRLRGFLVGWLVRVFLDCAAWHSGSSYLIRNRTQAPCIGSEES